MKSFSDIKRRFAPGVVLECTENTGLQTEETRERALGRRTIRLVQTNAIASTRGEGDWSGKRGDLFWTYFPKANAVNILDDNSFALHLWPQKPDCRVVLRFV